MCHRDTAQRCQVFPIVLVLLPIATYSNTSYHRHRETTQKSHIFPIAHILLLADSGFVEGNCVRRKAVTLRHRLSCYYQLQTSEQLDDAVDSVCRDVKIFYKIHAAVDKHTLKKSGTRRRKAPRYLRIVDGSHASACSYKLQNQ